MTIQITRNELWFEVPATLLRDTLRKIGDGSFHPEWLADRLKIPAKNAHELVAKMLEAGWLKAYEHDASWYELTKVGKSQSMAKATKPMKREKADDLLAMILDAAKEINADGGLPQYVESLAVFGSYLSDKDELGDLDICLDLRRRLGSLTQDEWFDWHMDYAYSVATSSTPYLTVLFMSEIVVRRRLRCKSTLVSIHMISEVTKLGTPTREVFKAKKVAAPKLTKKK